MHINCKWRLTTQEPVGTTEYTNKEVIGKKELRAIIRLLHRWKKSTLTTSLALSLTCVAMIAEVSEHKIGIKSSVRRIVRHALPRRQRPYSDRCARRSAAVEGGGTVSCMAWRPPLLLLLLYSSKYVRRRATSHSGSKWLKHAKNTLWEKLF